MNPQASHFVERPIKKDSALEVGIAQPPVSLSEATSPPSHPSAAARTHEIDGIRGWAAFCVLLYHLLHETFGAVLPAFRSPVFFAPINGALAVFVFFILSGDALSIGVHRRGTLASLDSLVLRRYTRLMVPVALATFILFVLMSFGWTWNRLAAAAVNSEGWLGQFVNFKPGVVSFARYVLIEVFSPTKVYSAPSPQYNPMLWTMPVELAGSMLVFVFWYLAPALKSLRGALFLLVGAMLCLGSYYSLFFFGVLLSQWRADGLLERFRTRAAWQVAAPILIVVAAYLNAANYEGENHRHLNLVCSMLLVFCFYTSRISLQVFRSRLSLFLGEVSFPLYLTHLAVIVSLTSWLIVRAGHVDAAAALEISLASVAVALVVAAAFRRVEKASLRRIDQQLGRLLVKRA